MHIFNTFLWKFSMEIDIENIKMNTKQIGIEEFMTSVCIFGKGYFRRHLWPGWMEGKWSRWISSPSKHISYFTSFLCKRNAIQGAKIGQQFKITNIEKNIFQVISDNRNNTCPSQYFWNCRKLSSHNYFHYYREVDNSIFLSVCSHFIQLLAVP